MASSMSRPPLTSTIVVLEARPFWTPELQRQFDGEPVVVRGCRNWSELQERSRDATAAVMLLELEGLAAECLSGLTRRLELAAREPVIVISSPRFAELEWVLREAGVSSVFPDLPTGADVARCCRRWLHGLVAEHACGI